MNDSDNFIFPQKESRLKRAKGGSSLSGRSIKISKEITPDTGYHKIHVSHPSDDPRKQLKDTKRCEYCYLRYCYGEPKSWRDNRKPHKKNSIMEFIRYQE